MNTIKVTIQTPNTLVKELIIEQLAAIGFNGFEEKYNTIYAFIEEGSFAKNEVEQIVEVYGLSYTVELIEAENWNAIWESNFKPIEIDGFVGIRANFHLPIENVAHEIIITPKMSFGTGHHATTFSIMQLMEHIIFTNKTVLDFGTGTGILAILANKLGATKICAIDNDVWCIENATENIAAINCQHITLLQANTIATKYAFNVVIANINKHIIIEHLQSLHSAAANNATVLLSGLLITDEAEIINLTTNLGWQHQKTIENNQWIAMQFTANVK